MTPKEKAIELVGNFTLFMGTDIDGNEHYLDKLYAKQCALIAVDEIISLFIVECEDTRFWQEVKKEIEKL